MVNNLETKTSIKTNYNHDRRRVSVSMAPQQFLTLSIYRTKKDYSTAIMDRKKAPHKLQVEDSKQDDNSIVEMTQAKMDELKIFRGDAVILKGKPLNPTTSFT